MHRKIHYKQKKILVVTQLIFSIYPGCTRSNCRQPTRGDPAVLGLFGGSMDVHVVLGESWGLSVVVRIKGGVEG